jgi:hypothetical protein
MSLLTATGRRIARDRNARRYRLVFGNTNGSVGHRRKWLRGLQSCY